VLYKSVVPLERHLVNVRVGNEFRSQEQWSFNEYKVVFQTDQGEDSSTPESAGDVIPIQRHRNLFDSSPMAWTSDRIGPDYAMALKSVVIPAR
jgi:hypothetical protein